MGTITHYYPDALVVFVKSFAELENIQPEDLLIASGQRKEVTAVHVTMTVGASPSTFNITLNDVANRLAIQDNPEEEVTTLRSNSEFQLHRDREQRNFKSITGDAVAYYEYDGFRDCKSPWVTFEHGVLVDAVTGERSVMEYRRTPSGDIVERWAFDSDGNLIQFSNAYDEAFFTSSLTNGMCISVPVKDRSDRKVHHRNYYFFKYSNLDFLTKYQSSVAEPLKVGRCRIEPMDRVAVFLSERFTRDAETGEYQPVQTPKTNLVRAFTGLVNTVQMGYNESGGNTVTVAGEDVTKWMRLSVIPVDPSLKPHLDQTGGNLRFSSTDVDNFSVFANIFTGLHTPDVIRLLTLGSEGLDPVARARMHSKQGVKFRGIGYYSAARTKQTNNTNIVYNAKTDTFVELKNGVQSATVSLIDFTGMLGLLFSKSSVHVVDPTETGLDVYNALGVNFKQHQTFQTEYQNRRDICYKAAADSNFNFYADRNGHIWFHPPRYSNAWILTQQNNKLCVLDDDSIISYGFVEDDTNVYSTCIVSSEKDLNQHATDDTILNRGSYTDEMIMHRFGTKIITMSNPFIAAMAGGNVQFSTKKAIFYAKTMLLRLMANKSQGQITITGRAELDPGYPVYIPFRNMIYWVETVEHSLQFGGRYETTLHLSYGHKPWEVIPEIVTQSIDVMQSTDGHIRLEWDRSTNQPQTDKTGNRRARPVTHGVLRSDTQTTPVVKPQDWMNGRYGLTYTPPPSPPAD